MKIITTFAALLIAAPAFSTDVWLYPRFPTGKLRGPTACTVDRIVDGDTLQLNCAPWFPRVRLFGVNAVESGFPGAAEAKAGLKRLLGEHEFLWGEMRYSDRYGRPVVIFRSLEDADLACQLMAERLVIEDPVYSKGVYAECAPEGGK